MCVCMCVYMHILVFSPRDGTWHVVGNVPFLVHYACSFKVEN